MGLFGAAVSMLRGRMGSLFGDASLRGRSGRAAPEGVLIIRSGRVGPEVRSWIGGGREKDLGMEAIVKKL